MDKLNKRWIVEKEQVAFKHPFMEVKLQQVRLPDNRIIPDWPIVSIRDYINVVAVDGAGKILIIEGYKHGIGRSSWQILGGYIDPGEEPLAAAKRELMEETGLTSDEWAPLGSFIIDANRRASQATFFVATNCRQVAEPDNQDLEDYVLRWESKSEVLSALQDGRIEGIGYVTPLALAFTYGLI
ncbi:MAG: ADP-ribose pyrophosphatase [Cellvibrionaceae bacterium]|jgi:ADP-ribose pyrophosphatase